MTATPARPEARRAQLAGLAFLAVMLVVGGLIAFGVFGGSDPAGDASVVDGVRGVEETSASLRGIPQNGIVLGDPAAPATIVEFADLKCSACRSFVLSEQPQLIEDLVRTGQANVELRLLANENFGPDTAEGRTAAHRLAATDRMWPLVDLLYFNQQDESERWITPTRLQELAEASPELRGTAVGVQETAETRALATAADTLSDRLDVTGTPAIFVRPRGRTAPDDHRPIDVGRFDDAGQKITDAVAAVSSPSS